MVRRYFLSAYAFVAALTAFSQTEVSDTLQLSQPNNIEIKEIDTISRPDTINSLDEKPVEYRYPYDVVLFQNPPLRYSRISVTDISFYNGNNGSIDYQATPWMSLSIYGTYYWEQAPQMANMMPMPHSMLGYFGYNKFGGYVDFHNENVGIQMGGQLVKGTYNSRYEVEPIATPYVKVGRGKKKIGIGLPVGQIIHGLFGR